MWYVALIVWFVALGLFIGGIYLLVWLLMRRDKAQSRQLIHEIADELIFSPKFMTILRAKDPKALFAQKE